MVAPSGIVKDATRLSTPSRCSTVRRVTGSVAPRAGRAEGHHLGRAHLAEEDARVEPRQQEEQARVEERRVHHEDAEHHEEVAEQRPEGVEALLGEDLGDQAEDADRGDAHQQHHQPHDHLVEVLEEPEGALPRLAGQRHRQAEEHGEDDDLQHVAIGHGLDGVGGEDLDQGLRERWRLRCPRRRGPSEDRSRHRAPMTAAAVIARVIATAVVNR